MKYQVILNEHSSFVPSDTFLVSLSDTDTDDSQTMKVNFVHPKYSIDKIEAKVLNKLNFESSFS